MASACWTKASGAGAVNGFITGNKDTPGRNIACMDGDPIHVLPPALNRTNIIGNAWFCADDVMVVKCQRCATYGSASRAHGRVSQGLLQSDYEIASEKLIYACNVNLPI
jgi:hypothetical protein